MITGGLVKARFGVGRMEYAVDPGLYALGNPDGDSPVFVSANYKMSFDELRRSLPGRDAWILVLDTDGINVWCAAGKGTFGTDELVRRIEATDLEKIIRHRKLILPQLAGPGVSAHQVKQRSGFSVHYGPIRAQDLPAYLESGLKATPGMRLKTFTLSERAVLIPVELMEALKPTLLILPVLFLLGGLGGHGGFWTNALHEGTLCGSGFFERPRGRSRVESYISSLSSREGVFHKRIVHRGPHGHFRSLSAGLRLADLDRADGGVLLASDHFRCSGISGDEFHGMLHVHIPFRGEKRDALGPAP